MSSRYEPNRRFDEELGRSQELRRFLEREARQVAIRARSEAPVGSSGNYRDGIEGVLADTPTGPVGRVNANDWKSAIIELHGVNDGRGPLAVLRKAAEAHRLVVRKGDR